MGGHMTSGGYYRILMYIGPHTSDTLHKKPCRTGPGLYRTSENSVKAKFAEFPFCEVRCIRAQVRAEDP
jgi:hypothetical protein